MAAASAKAYEMIRDRILDGRFPPGLHLKEAELVKTCGVSRTPVRDALRRLVSDQYVVTHPNQGTFVNSWSDKDIMDVFDLRALIEGYGARLAAMRHSKEQIAVMQQAYSTVAEMLERDTLDVHLYLRENTRFHQALAEASNNAPMIKQVATLMQPPVVARTALGYSRKDLIDSNNDHRDLIEAFLLGDCDWAESVMRHHILAAKYKFLHEKQRLNAPERAVI